jgi:hypothetical protein
MPALKGITTMDVANCYMKEHYKPKFNKDLTVGHDNCVSFEIISLQIPPDQYRGNYIKATVRVDCYLYGTMAIFHGPRKLAMYDCLGRQNVQKTSNKAA